MRLALVNNERVETQPKLSGTCPHCGAEIARWGRVKVWHWAHKGELACDPWWDNETEWHRAWKDQFPLEWQEVIAEDPATGEKHIADVRTSFGLVVEFQHSPIDPAEVKVRERFCGNMIWIVDCNRGSLDKGHFNIGFSGTPTQIDPLAYAVKWWGGGRLRHNWRQVSAQVYLDFGDDTLWRLILFDADRRIGAVGPIQERMLIEDVMNGRRISVLSKS
jgi:competence protein CoiA